MKETGFFERLRKWKQKLQMTYFERVVKESFENMFQNIIYVRAYIKNI